MAAAEARLRRLADAAPAGAIGARLSALAHLVLGTGEGEQGQLAAAEQDLAAAATYAPIQDAATEALTRFAAPQDAAAVLAAAERYPIAEPDPFRTAIALRAAHAALQLNAFEKIQAWTAGLPASAEVVWLQAQAAAGLNQTRRAAELERDLIYTYPASPEARQATAAWENALGAMPELAPGWNLLARQAGAWSAAGQPREAAADWLQAAELAPPQERDRLRANAARAQMAAGERTAAAALAQELLAGGERAQAMEIEVELDRAQHDAAALDPAVAALGREFPTSSWYARALHEAGDEALIEGDTTWVETYFDRLSRSFPRSAYAPNASWQAAWAAYRQGQPETAARLEALLERYPRSSLAVDALYWRGRWAEAHHAPGVAAACYQAAAHRFPGTYFGLQARQRLHGRAPRLRAAWLVPYLVDPPTPRAAPIPAQLAPELQRAGWLQQAGLDDVAAEILNHALRELPPGAPSLALARRLAALDAEREDWHGGLEAMLRAVPDYLALEPAQLPIQDWRRLFPIAYPGDLDAAARHSDVPRGLLLGVMRQESGFDPGSVSSARARGLMQLELGTAAAEFRRLPAPWRALAGDHLDRQALLNPGLSLGLGADELAALLRRYPAAEALAAYNAGAARVDAWKAMFGPLPVNEFIETIPFAQTREYVQGVLRNQAHYAALYGLARRPEPGESPKPLAPRP